MQSMYSDFMGIRFLLLLIFVGLFSANAHAQANFPEFSLSEIENNRDTVTQDKSDISSIGFNRRLTIDILVLQEQINILEGLVKRQGEINKIAKDYEKLGLPFKQPAPNLSACKKLPANLLCFYAYPDLEINAEIAQASEERFKQRQEEAMIEALNQMAMTVEAQEQLLNTIADAPEALSAEIADIISETQPAEEKYAWEDIRCIHSDCNALLISSLDKNKRFRVSRNEVIDDNIKVVMINPLGVKIKKKGEVINLQPVSLDGGIIQSQKMMSSSTANMSVQSGNVQQVLDENAMTSLPKKTNETQKTTPPTAQPASEAPLLGPTGLF